MSKKIIRCVKKDSKTLVNFKATDSEHQALQKNADQYCDGNLSAWIRYSAVSCKPKSKDLVEK